MAEENKSRLHCNAARGCNANTCAHMHTHGALHACRCAACLSLIPVSPCSSAIPQVAIHPNTYDTGKQPCCWPPPTPPARTRNGTTVCTTRIAHTCRRRFPSHRSSAARACQCHRRSRHCHCRLLLLTLTLIVRLLYAVCVVPAQMLAAAAAAAWHSWALVFA